MRTPSHQSVTAWVLAASLGVALACGQAGSSSRAVGPSPLLEMDADRLWILLWARRDMEPGCGAYYAQPDDLRYADRRGACERWELNVLDMLRANGLQDVEGEHLRAPQFWAWYEAKAQEIGECSKRALHAQELSAPERLRASVSCDPYRKLTRVEKRSPDQAGIDLPLRP